MILEALCLKCGDTFNPANEDDLEHGMNNAQTEVCGGEGEIQGEWHFEPDTIQEARYER